MTEELGLGLLATEVHYFSDEFHNPGTGSPDSEGWIPGCTHLLVLVLLNNRPGSERCVQCVLNAWGRFEL